MQYKHNIVLNYLENKYTHVLCKYKDAYSTKETLKPDCPIWVCWYQGEVNMPPIVKACYNSIKQHSAHHSVHLITSENIEKYISMPQYIADKVKRGTISLTQYSDIIRNKILSIYGGIWLDATLYLTDELKNWEYPFYSLKQNKQDDLFFVSRYRWSSYCMGGVKNNLINIFVSELLYEYHKKQSILIDYFLIDYAIELGYKNIPAIRNMIDNIPLSNPYIFYLDNNLKNRYDECEFSKIKKDTHIFKLSWKLNNVSSFPKDSYYKKILSNSI